MNDRRLAQWCGLALLAILSLFVAACLFTHPIADDLDFASGAREAGLFTAWRQQYLTWNGRYSSNLLALAVPLGGDTLVGYRMALVAMLAGTVAATYVFLRSLTDAFARIEVAAGALVLCGLYFCEMPAVGEGIFWYSSAVTYQAAIVVAALHFACVVRGRRANAARLPLSGAVAALVVVAGFNEVMMVMMVAAYGALLGAAVVEHDRAKPAVAMLLAAALASAFVVMHSPGNAARLQEYPLRHQLGRSLVMTSLQTIRFVAAWLASGPLLLASILWLSNADRLRAAIVPPPRPARLLFCLAGLLFVVPLAAFPAYWATGMLGQQRTMNTAYFAFLVLWFGALTLWATSGSLRARVVCAAAVELRLPLAVLLVISLAFTRNTYAIGSDFVTGRFRQFDQEMQERQRALRECRDLERTTCDIDPIRTVPASFFVLDVAENPDDWVNVAYARYSGLAQVRLRRPFIGDHVRY